MLKQPTISQGEAMSPAPPLAQFIGRTERTLRALMEQVLAGTGGTFDQWVALNFTAVNGDSIDRSQLIARLADALQIDETAAEATITYMSEERLLQTASGSVVSLSDAGRERYARIRAAIEQTTAPLYADISADDLATARRVLTTISARAKAQLAQACPGHSSARRWADGSGAVTIARAARRPGGLRQPPASSSAAASRARGPRPGQDPRHLIDFR
jgi:DNA-binding MarR family transcriptional regulator